MLNCKLSKGNECYENSLNNSYIFTISILILSLLSEKAVTEREFDYKVDAKTTKSPKPTPAIPTSSYNSKSRKYGKPSNPKAPVADQQAQTLDDTLPSKAFRRSPASRFATKN